MAKGNPTPRKGRSVFSSQRTERGIAWLRALQENALAQFVLFVSFIVAIVGAVILLAIANLVQRGRVR